MDRRDFIKLLGIAGTNAAAYTACSSYMSNALASSTLMNDLLTSIPDCQKGSLKDIEHVVILMQENRSFDHYYGTLRGIRGFGDPRPAKQPHGEVIWNQAASAASSRKIKPYRVPKGSNIDTDAGDLYLIDPAHGFDDGIAAWNWGNSNKWIEQKGIVTMAHFVEPDIPLYFQLAKAFTICDAYHCSVNGPTDPNRSYFFTGASYSRVENSNFSGLRTDNWRPDWKSYPEKLEELGVDWKFYQDGVGWPSGQPFSGNYGDNTLEYFKQYRGAKKTAIQIKNQTVNSVLRTEVDKPSQFEQDIIDDKLPAVSWIVAPEAFSEHPQFPPHFGEYYLSEILRALLANKNVWHKTALLITYDENGGFFDHVLPPVPPLNNDQGLVSPGIKVSASGNWEDVNSEFTSSKPVGLGMRVPMLVISPWSWGGRVCSETFDHTSVIRLLDTWLKAKEKQPQDAPVFPNISSWRQAVVGDLTSAFDFDRTNANPMDGVKAALQPTKIYSDSEKKHIAKASNAEAYRPDWADVIADEDFERPVSVKQDKTPCDLLPVGYDFQVFSKIQNADRDYLAITFRNRGRLGAGFTVLSYDRSDGGWFYTVEGVKEAGAPIELVDTWKIDKKKYAAWLAKEYSYAVHGPNGYLAEFRGTANSAIEEKIPDLVEVNPSTDGKAIEFVFAKWPTANGKLRAVSAYTGDVMIVTPDITKITFPTKDGWYDISFVDAQNTSNYLRRYAGHAENGKISRTDPAIGLKYDEAKRIYVEVVA